MPYLNVMALERAESKIQGARATAETVMTHQMMLIASGSSFTIDQEHELVEEMTVSYQPYFDTQFGPQRSTIRLEFIATYEDLIWWDNHIGAGGALTGTTTGSTPPGYTYANVPSSTADNIAVSTWKLGDGATCYRFARAVVQTFTVNIDPESQGTWRCTAELKAIFMGTSTFDAPAIGTQTKVVSFGTQVYIDSIGGTIGTTQITGRIRKISVTWTLNIEEKSFIETGVQAHTDFGRGYYAVTFELVMEHTDDTWRANAMANTPYKIRIQQTGAQIGVTPTTNYRRRIDFNRAKLRVPTFGRSGQNKIATFGGFMEKPTGSSGIQTETVIATTPVAA